MPRYRCRLCNFPVTQAEIQAGECPTCHERLDAVAYTATAPTAAAGPACHACGAPGAWPGYLRLRLRKVWMFIGRVDLEEQNLHVRCCLCGRCRFRLRAIGAGYIMLMMVLWALPVVGFGLGIYFTNKWEKENRAFRPGTPASVQAAIGFYVLPFATWVVGVFGLITVRGALSRRVFRIQTRERMSQAFGTGRWAVVRLADLPPTSRPGDPGCLDLT